jgi:serine/threonine protein kinase/Tfp pilus assembly protein PilF
MPENRENDRTHTHVALTAGAMVSHYRIIEKIGAGGMGEVYLAEDTQLNRKVALKFLPLHLCQDEDCRARFKREAQAVAVLKHPNIVTIYEVSEYLGRPYFAMEHIEGPSLRDLIKDKQLSLDKIIDLAIQIGEGLGKAHQAGVTHRDIKPSNVAIDADGRPKILDFGLATIRGGEHITKTGSTLGTVRYMSPEQVQGEEIDHRSDLFSLGVLLYEMITGLTPFARENDVATAQAIVSATPEPLTRYRSNVSDDLQRIVWKLMEKDPAYRYQTASGVVSDLRQERRRVDSGKSSVFSSAAVRPTPKKKLTKILIPSSALALIVLLILVLKPWKFEVQPTHEAMAAENRLAIMYFDNLADPADSQRLGEIVTNLLITDLSESRYLDVVSSQRLYDILKLLGKEGAKMLDREVATQVATKAGAGRMLLGSILQVKPQIVITSQLIEVRTGSVVASQRVTGTAEEQIFSLVDKLSVEIKNDLSLPAQAHEEPDRPVADVTTHSPEAYRYYLDGLELFNKLYYAEAKKSFEKAVEFDSTFAMAYLFLSMTAEGGLEQKRMIAKAVEYSDKVSQKEKYYISAQAAVISSNPAQAAKVLEEIVKHYPEEKEAFLWLGSCYSNLGNPEKAVAALTKAVEIDPLYKIAYNLLAYAYNDIGDLEKSLWAINKYISIAPDEANPYDTRADLYAYNGRIDQAIESYKKALERKPDFYMSLAKLGDMHLFRNEYTEAESCYQQLSSSNEKEWRSTGRAFLAVIPLYQGKLEQALQVLEDGLAADRMEQYNGMLKVWKHALKATIYREKKNLNAAIKEAEAVMEIMQKASPQNITYGREYYIELLAENNQFEKAEQVAAALKKDIEEKDTTQMASYWFASGSIDLARGNAETAVAHLEKADEMTRSPSFYTRFSLAKAYLESGKLGEAVAVLEKALSRYDMDRASSPISSVKAHYLLGLAYEKSGWTNKAIEQYETFLNIWKNADPGIEEINDAKERLAHLKSKS